MTLLPLAPWPVLLVLAVGALAAVWWNPSSRSVPGESRATHWRLTAAVVLLEWLGGSTLSAAVAVTWLSLLMFANALFHVAGAVVDRAYMPGLVTALLLYLPFYAWLVVRVIQLRRLPRGAVVAAATIGALPMLVHGYLIVFRGSRLF